MLLQQSEGGHLQNFDSTDGIALKRTRWRWMFDVQLAEVLFGDL
jgi:hypothetical protein